MSRRFPGVSTTEVGQLGSDVQIRSRYVDVGRVLELPKPGIRTAKRQAVVNVHRDVDVGARSDVVAQPAEHLPAAGQDKHHGPIGPAKDPFKRLLVGLARLGRVARVRVNPDPRELLRLAAGVDLGVKKVGHRLVFELDVGPGGGLSDERDVLDQQQIVGRRNPEPADLGFTFVT